jgi:hypothetical protein
MVTTIVIATATTTGMKKMGNTTQPYRNSSKFSTQEKPPRATKNILPHVGRNLQENQKPKIVKVLQLQLQLQLPSAHSRRRIV